MIKFTKAQIVTAIEKAKTVNVWAISDKVEITFDHDSNKVVVWNATGDYDAHYNETDLKGILNEAAFIEGFVA
jgi:hypothetical protein